MAEERAHQYVIAFIKVRSRRVIAATIDGEVITDGPIPAAADTTLSTTVGTIACGLVTWACGTMFCG